MNKKHELLAKIFLADVDPISCNSDRSKAYLIEQGINPDSVKEEGMKRLKMLQLKIKAAKTKREMLANEKAKEQAMEWVEKILSDASFSFSKFVKEENLVLQNRSLESFTKDDIKHTLTQYLFMKILGQDNKFHA